MDLSIRLDIGAEVEEGIRMTPGFLNYILIYGWTILPLTKTESH